MKTTAVRQRADLTFKHNKNAGRHGWLRLTPAYSVKLVEAILSRWPDAQTILDPFAGTGTTPVCASYNGRRALAVDINPFLVWLSKAKARCYSEAALGRASEAARTICEMVQSKAGKPSKPPPIHNLARWWAPEALDFLCYLKGALDSVVSSLRTEGDLLRVAFCRTVISLSNAAFNHQSMSFKASTKKHEQQLLFGSVDMTLQFAADIDSVITSAANNPSGTTKICLGDSRRIEESVSCKTDLVITSPPYPNRMSYIRELRPYMYWLGYLKEAREAGELDWKAIGGTWGIATSRLVDWKLASEAYQPPYLSRLLKSIAQAHPENGRLLSNYVAKYFEDTWMHLCSLANVVSRGGSVHYIVGNSSFYGILVPTERLYADMLREAGFTSAQIETVRKRNSKKELYEYIVTATR